MKNAVRFAVIAVISALLPAVLQGADKATAAPITADQIVQENSAARGGIAAWKAVESFTMVGRIYTGDSQAPRLNFLLEVKQPGKARMEIRFPGQRSAQVFDGLTAWRMAPFLQKYDAQPDGPQTSMVGVEGLNLGGPLLDFNAKDVPAELEGTEVVDGHEAYRVRLMMKDGGFRRMWVDTGTFLEIKVECNPRIINGRLHAVTTHYRDYKPVQGLMIPHFFETVIDGMPKTEKAAIDAIEVNPKLDDTLFVSE